MRYLIIILFLLPISAFAGSLTFGAATSDNIRYPTSSAAVHDLDPATFCAWVRPTTFTTNRRFYQITTPAATGRRLMSIHATTGDFKDLISTTGTVAEFQSTSTPLAPLGTWKFVCERFRTSANPRVNAFVGTATSTIAEISYQTRVDGTGPISTSTGGFFGIANNASGTANASFQGQIAFVSYMNAFLERYQMAMIQWCPVTAKLFNSKLHVIVGVNTSIQPDWSGNGGRGVITGATYSPITPPILNWFCWR